MTGRRFELIYFFKPWIIFFSCCFLKNQLYNGYILTDNCDGFGYLSKAIYNISIMCTQDKRLGINKKREEE